MGKFDVLKGNYGFEQRNKDLGQLHNEVLEYSKGSVYYAGDFPLDVCSGIGRSIANVNLFSNKSNIIIIYLSRAHH